MLPGGKIDRWRKGIGRERSRHGDVSHDADPLVLRVCEQQVHSSIAINIGADKTRRAVVGVCDGKNNSRFEDIRAGRADVAEEGNDVRVAITTPRSALPSPSKSAMTDW